MVVLNLIEERFVARHGVVRYGKRPAAYAKRVAAPLEIAARRTAHPFDRRPIVRMKKLLPARIDSGGEVPHVPQALGPELRDDVRIDGLQRGATIEQGGIAARRRRAHAMKRDAERPACQMRASLWKRIIWSMGIPRRFVNMAACARARQIAVIAEEFPERRLAARSKWAGVGR